MEKGTVVVTQLFNSTFGAPLIIFTTVDKLDSSEWVRGSVCSLLAELSCLVKHKKKV